MFFEILLFVLAGILVGTFTGLTPGIHINLVSLMLLSASPFLLQYFNVLSLASFIISLSVAHTLVDFIPSIFLGVPEEGTALSVLPGHRFVLEGMGYEAVKLSIVGAVVCFVAFLLVSPLLFVVVPIIFSYVKNYVGYILIGVSLFTIFRQKNKKHAIMVYFIAGLLGVFVFDLNLGDPLFPLFSGLFGISTLLISLNDKVEIPKQRTTEHVTMTKKELMPAIGSGLFSGSLVSIFPALGPAQAAVIAGLFTNNSPKNYLVLVGGINSVSMMMSLVTLYAIEKARNGSIVAVQELMNKPALPTIILLFAVAALSMGISVFISLYLAKLFSKLINFINYKTVCLVIISAVSLLVLILTGFTGFLVLVISCAAGLLAPLLEVDRSISMSCIILPIILYFI